MRPIRYCEKCGEYVDDGYREVRQGRFTTLVPCLIHINGDGVQIYRSHAAVEDTR